MFGGSTPLELSVDICCASGSCGQHVQDSAEIRRFVWHLRRHDDGDVLSLGRNTIRRFDQQHWATVSRLSVN